jgi:hypothetical protein
MHDTIFVGMMVTGTTAAVATGLKCHRRRQFRNVTGRYGAAVGAAKTSHIATAPTAAAELALFEVAARK